jgi:tetratricopeptide (TPR) repeat protein
MDSGLLWTVVGTVTGVVAAGLTAWQVRLQLVEHRLSRQLHARAEKERPPVAEKGADDSAPSTAASQVVIGEIPREPPGFVPREIVGRLANAADGGRMAVVCAVTGMRGVGKTQVAAAYARARIAEGWGLVGWVGAETADGRLAGLSRIAERLGVADPEGDSAESARRLREHLTSRVGLGLLVFDNAADPDGLRLFLPAAGDTQIVVTSTDRSFAELGEIVDVSVFSREESLGFLRGRTGLADETYADAVAGELGDLPLGLAQAAATIRSQRLNYQDYLGRLRRVPVAELLGRVPGGDYAHATAAALLLSVQMSEDGDRSGLAGRLLRMVAALSPDGVQRELLDGLADGDSSGTEMIDAAVERCVAGSLLTWSVAGDVVIMHRLLGRTLRERDQAAGRWDASVKLALDMLEPRLHAVEDAWVRRAEGAALITHIESLWEAGADGSDDPDLTLRLLQARSWAVRQLLPTADLSRSIDLGVQVLADCERLLGGDHPQTLSSRLDLARTYWAASRIGEAIELSQATLTDHERVLGRDHPRTIDSRLILAFAYEQARRRDDAISVFEATLADSERVLGLDHPNTLLARLNLAGAYSGAGRPDGAITLLEATLADCERIIGHDHAQTLATQDFLATAYHEAGRLDEAITLFEATVADCERVLGRDHPKTLTSKGNRAGAYRAAGRLSEAIGLYESTVADCERVLGNDHPDTTTYRTKLDQARTTASLNPAARHGRKRGSQAGSH